ncbi:CbiX/SirB N-terminal domain-containing protein [Nitrospinae bacterium]|nr:CbiX/SirB N-terminal domain-containing protein [Nitrospinota bacterium]
MVLPIFKIQGVTIDVTNGDKMENNKQAVILIGHGGLPNDIPKNIVEDFMKIHKQRIRTGIDITSKEIELDSTIRNWERTPESDPYKSGLEKLANHLAPQLEGFILKTAYNEFCYPSIEQAADELVNENVTEVILITTMITPGGSHSEKEIPEEVDDLRKKYPKISFQYAWPYDLDIFANLLSGHIKRFTKTSAI